jgi:hypothetical protein
MIDAVSHGAGRARFGAFGAGTAIAFAFALVVFAAASLAAAGDFRRVDRAAGGEFERAAASVDAARSALQAFDAWRSAVVENASSRRKAVLENRFTSLLDRAEQRAASTPTRAAASAIRAALAQWRQAKPLDSRYAALEPALEEARAVQLRLHLTLMVETAVTQSLFVQRAAATTASRAKWTSVLAVFAAAAAAAIFLFAAARFCAAFFVSAPAAPPAKPPEEKRATDAVRIKAAERLAAMRAFEAERRMRTDLPFALRGAAPIAIDG